MNEAAVPSMSLSKFFPISLEILEEIFLNLPPGEVVRVCRVVCHQWKEVVDSKSLWKERCRREGYNLSDTSKNPEDWRLFYFLCKQRRNLLKNPRGEEELSGWLILNNDYRCFRYGGRFGGLDGFGGNRWAVHAIREPHPDETVQKNFVTSYNMAKKSQLIDLEKEGYSPSFMDHFQPDIRISDWYAPRCDCGCIYEIRAELLNEKKRPIQTFAPEIVEFTYGSDERWNEMAHVFKNYGPGVRYVIFTHGGRDTQFWAGWYGIRLTESCVEICPAADK
ncbi:F-box only protein 6-like [Trematomus bernacchii]|uniref:F-box only protein 6-like n=1 Tax=Trematomus bernacchii TaxID=40690 RepID=UPI00146D2EC9|nr:F-box only protein 6-like [Trematomus bernacchii]